MSEQAKSSKTGGENVAQSAGLPGKVEQSAGLRRKPEACVTTTGGDARPTTTGRDARPTTLPRWQEISGLTPQREEKMSEDERDAAIRKLLAETERLARAECARGEKTPPGERTVFWDPLVRVCKSLGISRTKLSGYSRELSGLRAHEIGDRIKGKDLPKYVHAWVETEIGPILENLRGSVDRARLGDEKYRKALALDCWRQIKLLRSGPARARWALDLGFPNPSRLSRACLLAQGKSIDELEWEHVQRMVQKFLEELHAEGSTGVPAGERCNPTGTEARPTDVIKEEAVAVSGAAG